MNGDPGPMARWEEARGEGGTLGMIVQRIGEGETLRGMCKSLGWPHGKVLEWLVDDGQRSERYRRAKWFGAHADVDLARDIALGEDGKGGGDGKLAVDTLWRGAEAHAREVYGRQMKVERTVAVVADAGLVVTMGELLARITVPALPAVRVIEAEPAAQDEPAQDESADLI